MSAQVFSAENPAAMIVIFVAIFFILVAVTLCVYKKSRVLSACFRRKSCTRAEKRTGNEVSQVVQVEPATPLSLMGERTPSSFLGGGKDEKKTLDALEKGIVPMDVLQVCVCFRFDLERFGSHRASLI